MNRIAAMAIASAAVIGIVGGTYAATSGVLESDDGNGSAGTTGTESSTPGDTQNPPATDQPSGTASTETPGTDDEPLLYMVGGTIHDGDTSVQVSGFRIGEVSSLQRVAGGWLVVSRTSSQDAQFRAAFVDPSGETTPIGGTFVGTWDLNDNRDSFVAMYDGAYQVRDARSGKVLQTITVDGEGEPSGEAAFSEDTLVTAWFGDDGPTLYGVDSYSGRQFKIVGDVYQIRTGPVEDLMTASRTDGKECLTGGSIVDPDGWWSQCRFRGYGTQADYSPDGTRLLAVPADTEGMGPGRYAVLDARTGKKMTTFTTPELGQEAYWAGDDEVFVHAFKDADFNGGVIYRCSLSGSCEVEVSSDQTLVVGTTA
ncbi:MULTISPECIES: hypothetical protein [unclassified Nocardioides]|uniref:hypothetical protein n=1 Tax=unclassified Nocardioides TaxID=2615069 RepID=UPI0006F49AF9|nr:MULTISPECIES: hypothetical protein [unclassified Nocardioides]KQY56974.1 hypothetical protein ASD30_11945 [Nocardioides sp. Root140]KRF13098.1 hypothetical protein ASH02_16590 [Nocardioides sp. Soil796]